MDYNPKQDRVIVRPKEDDKTTASGLFIATVEKDAPGEGEVLAVGPGRFAEETGVLIPVDIKVGDTVLYVKGSGTIVSLNGEKLVVLRESEIFAVSENDTK